jgi:protein ImuB
VVPDEGWQLGLWGQALVSDRVARAAAQVQAMLGHEAVIRPVLSGGRGPGDQVTFVPFGDSQTPQLPADRPWPGRIPSPSPATVYPRPLPASVTCAAGKPVTVTGRAAISAPPAWLAIDGTPPLEITAWTGPWPVDEQWWDPAHARRVARFQLVTQDETAWLAAIESGRWVIEASYG